VYFTLIPVLAVKREGVNLAMSCICPLATIATLIVLAVLRPDAGVASIAASTATAAMRATTPVLRLRTSSVRVSCMVAASS
jgi:hypothetical protein